MKNVKKTGLGIVLWCFLFSTACAQPKIIIKLDDLGSRNGIASCKPVLDLLLQHKIKAGLGVIANRLDTTAAKAYAPYIYAVNDKGETLFEFWNHGYDHSDKLTPGNSYEFGGTTFDFQAEHLRKADERVRELLGVEMQTFGAPYNVSDSLTIAALGQRSNYRIILFGNAAIMGGSRLENLNKRVNMENGTGMVNYDFFVTQYTKYKSRYPDYMVLQGHPNQWDADRLQQFAKILDFLVAERCEFVLPAQYVKTLKRSW